MKPKKKKELFAHLQTIEDYRVCISRSYIYDTVWNIKGTQCISRCSCMDEA